MLSDAAAAESKNTGSEFSRRTFISGTAAVVGSLIADKVAGAQSSPQQSEASSINATVHTSGDVTKVPHSFGLQQKPVQMRSPLAPAPFVALPLGSVKARGWLLTQLQLQRDGLTGHAEEVLPATAPNSAWKGGQGEDWEKGPYYVKGLIPLAYTLDDPVLKAKVAAWVEPILASQREDGFFGPKKNDDWWPRMVATYLLRDYAEATGDARVIPFLTRYYRHMSDNLPKRVLRKWGRARAGDEIDTVFWLYNRTGDEFLLSLADLLHEQAHPWRQIFTENQFFETDDESMVTHNVNVPQALKTPVVYSQRSRKTEDRAAYRAGIAHLMRDHGTSFGINSGSERLSGRSSLEGVELCSMVEYMLSAETAIRILGDARIGDELELVAFNGLPAALTKSIHQHVYFTLSNNVNASRGGLGWEQDYGSGRTPAPISGFPCCCYNFHMGWPKLAQNAWAATSDGGLAVMAYVPSQVSAPVAGGQVAGIVCDTNYPFDETIRLSVNLSEATRFPLQLRVPGWCLNAQIKVNGKKQPKVRGGTFATINRVWKDGDRVELVFPMSTQTERGINDSVSIRRGPLIYVLGLNENWKEFERSEVPGFEAYEVTSETPWNYALAVDSRNPAKSFVFQKKLGTANPFETGRAPVALRVQARRINAWKIRFDGRAALDPPVSPVISDAPLQVLELVPFGSQMLRVSEFPTLGSPSALPSIWREDFSGDYSQRWVVYRGSYVRDGQLHLPFKAKGVAARAQFTDFVYDCDVIVGDKGNAGVLFRVSDASVGTDMYRGYFVGISAEQNRVEFGKSNNAWTSLSSAKKNIETGRAHRVRVEARGPHIRIWVDDMTAPILEAHDDSFTSGVLGVRSYAPKAAFANLSANAI